MQSCVICCLSCVAAVGANSLFSHCIQKAGFAFTSPGYSFYHWEAKAFDPGPEGSLLLLQALENARMGSADDISLVCIASPLRVHLCITAHCKATQTSPIIMLCHDLDPAQCVKLCDQFLWSMQSSRKLSRKHRAATTHKVTCHQQSTQARDPTAVESFGLSFRLIDMAICLIDLANNQGLQGCKPLSCILCFVSS